MVKMISISFDRIGTVAVRQGFSLRLTLFIVFVSLFPEIRTQTSLPGNPILSIIDAKNEGDTVTLTCTSYGGNPLPTVRWYKNTQLVDPGSSPNGNGDGVFTVGSTTATYNNYTFQVSRSDNAVSYICKVNSSLLTSELTRSLRIEVYVPADNPIISGPTAATALDANKNYNHTCTAANGYPVVNIVWRLGTSFGTSQDLSLGVSGRTFRISESTTTNSDSTLTKVSVLSWTPITADNGNILFCVTTQLTAPGGSVPNITKSTNVLISVQQIPILRILNTSYTIEVGQAVTLGCRIVSALPPATRVSWSRFVNGVYSRVAIDNVRYFGSTVSNPNLTITNVALSDATTYQCSATNNAGTGNSGMTLLTVTGSQPTPFIPLTSYSVLIGNDVQIPCTVSANPAATLIQWQFTSNSGSSTPISQSTTKYTLVGDSATTSNLTINSAALTDAGTYRCSATNIVGTGSDSATLTITGNAATVTVSPPTQSVLQKSTAIIQCIINNANPGVTEVLWEKISSGTTSSVIVTGRFNGSTPSLPNLIISDLQPSDAGTYYCSARNAIGTSRSSTGSNLIVTGAVPNSVQIVGATSRTVNLGGSLTLQCSGQGNPAPTLSWIFSSSTSDATTVGTGTTYSITNAQRTNGGTYVCRGTNSLGSTDSQGVTVDVQYAPIDARTDAQKSLSAAVGSTVSLVCAVDANPVASYEWYRNSQPVSNQRQYTFTLSSPDLVGSYTCKATNSRGSVELLYTLSQGNAGNTGASTATSGLSTGEIAAIILAVLLLLILIIIIIICCLTHGACGVICGKKQDVKGRVEPEKEVYKETQKEVVIPRFHEESIKGKRQPSAVSRKDVDIRVQNGGFRRENDYEIVRYETVPAAPPISTQYITESPRPHHLPALSYTYEDVEKKRKKRRKKKKHHHRRHHGEAEEVVVETVRSASPVRIIQEPVEEVVVERVIRSRSASPTRVIRTEAEEPTVVERVIRSSSPTRVYRQDIEEPVDYPPSPSRRHGGYYDDERIIETRRSTRSPQRYRRESDEEMIIERRSPSTKRRYEENYITEERYSSGDVVQDDGDLRAYNGVVYREAPSRHSGGHYRVHGSERRSRSRSGRRERGSDDDVEVVYGKEYVVER